MCRGLNLLLGMSGSVHFERPSVWLVAGSYGLFVCGVTWISRSEVGNGPRRNIALGGALQFMALVGWLLAVAYAPRAEVPALTEQDGDRIALEQSVLFEPWLFSGLMICLAVGLLVGWRVASALDSPEPRIVQRAVKTGIFTLIWLHVGLLLAVVGPAPALMVGWLWFPAVFTGRWIYST
jgi:hypothetical protein